MATSAAPQRWTRLVTAGRMDGRMLLGVALVAVSIIGGLLLWGSASNTAAVVVANKDMAQGHVIAAGDLSTTKLRAEGGLSSLVIPQAEVGSSSDAPPARASWPASWCSAQTCRPAR